MLILVMTFKFDIKSKGIKVKNNKKYVKSSAQQRKSSTKGKRQPMKREKVFANNISNKGLLSKYTRNSYNSTAKKANNLN